MIGQLRRDPDKLAENRPKHSRLRPGTDPRIKFSAIAALVQNDSSHPFEIT